MGHSLAKRCNRTWKDFLLKKKKKKKKVTRGGFCFFTFNPAWNMSILKFLKIIRERETDSRQGGRKRERREKRLKAIDKGCESRKIKGF